MRWLARDHGKINFMALLMLAGFAGFVYFMAFYLPPWSRNRTVISAMHEAAYRAWQDDDPKLKAAIRRQTDPVWVVQDGNGSKPLIDDDAIVISRDDQQVHIGIEYTVLAKLPFTDDWREVSFDNDVSASLENPRLAKKSTERGFWSFLGLE